MTNVFGRPALYYPYIHIRSEHWLKATLLCVPTVKRIVPQNYVPEDDPQIVRYTEITGPHGALLQAVPAYSHAADRAQRHLLDKLRMHEDEIKLKYGRSQSPSPDDYWVHDAKFNNELLEYLSMHDLAWPSSHGSAYGHRSWYALHPILGSAIMTTLGLSIARERQYDIVTPSTQFHETLLATKEDAIFDAVLAGHEAESSQTAVQMRQDLGQLVITLTGVNYQALRPEDIPELQASKHFAKFQSLIRASAQHIDPDAPPIAYEEQLTSEAQAIIETWHDTKNELGANLKNALFDDALKLSAQALTAYILGSGAKGLYVAGGLSVALFVKKALRLKEKRRRASPFQYLTQITKAQTEFLRMAFPLGLER